MLTGSSSNSLEISWNIPDVRGAKATTYTIYWRIMGASTESRLSTNVVATTTRHVISNLRPSTSYYIEVVARNSVGKSEPLERIFKTMMRPTVRLRIRVLLEGALQ